VTVKRLLLPFVLAATLETKLRATLLNKNAKNTNDENSKRKKREVEIIHLM